MNEYLNEYLIEYRNSHGLPCSITVFSHNPDEAREDALSINPNIRIDCISLINQDYTMGVNKCLKRTQK
jgi:hypothetical protein